MVQRPIVSGERVSVDREELGMDTLRGDPGEGAPGAGDPGAGASGAQCQGSAGDGRGGGPEAPLQDGALRALDALSEALVDLAEDQRLLESRLREMRRRRSEGRAWRDILAEEEAPGTMQVVSRMLARLAKASGTLRKELVDSLRREGVSIPAIARLFGVTHQRVSNLLRRPTEQQTG